MNDIFSYAWKVFSHNFRYLTHLIVPFLLLGFLSYFTSQPVDENNIRVPLIGLVLYLLGFSMYMGALIFFVSQEYQKKLDPVTTNLFNSMVYAPLLMLTLLITNLPLIIVVILITTPNAYQFIALPLLLFGIYVSLKATFAPFHLMLEGCNPVVAIKKSFRHTDGRVGKIIIILLAFYLFTALVDGLTHFKTPFEVFNSILFLVGVALTLLMVALQQIAVFKLYVNSCVEMNKEQKS
ncbi:MAG: hypothetical protein KJ804_08900 [Proteobacteria bacterium]|nr:hypothetical protein [Pseudomonadota bacterium]MBU1058416.1 hypothetical protein [Pseudomonadota bacterium]